MKEDKLNIETLIVLIFGFLIGMILISLINQKPNYNYIITDSNNKKYYCDTFYTTKKNCITFLSKTKQRKRISVKQVICGSCKIEKIK